MKCTLFLVSACVIFTIAKAQSDQESMISKMAELFSISRSDVERCFNKTKTTAQDMLLFEDIVDDEESKNMDPGVSRRSSCTLTCCAQYQGTMTGAKLNMPAIHNLIEKAGMPSGLKYHVHLFVNECNEQVLNITDQCDVGIAFAQCMLRKLHKYQSSEEN